MHFVHPGPPDHLTHIVLPDPTTRHDGDAAATLIDKPSNGIGTFQCRRGPARSEDSAYPGIDQLLESLGEVARVVKSAVKSYRQSGRGCDQLARRRDIYSAILVECAGYNALRTLLPGELDVTPHYIDLAIRIGERAATRSNQHEYRNAHVLGRRCDKSGTRSRSAVVKACAQLDPSRSRALRGERGLKRVYCCFNESQSKSARFLQPTCRPPRELWPLRYVQAPADSPRRAVCAPHPIPGENQ